jgi:hypothetical protein
LPGVSNKGEEDPLCIVASSHHSKRAKLKESLATLEAVSKEAQNQEVGQIQRNMACLRKKLRPFLSLPEHEIPPWKQRDVFAWRRRYKQMENRLEMLKGGAVVSACKSIARPAMSVIKSLPEYIVPQFRVRRFTVIQDGERVMGADVYDWANALVRQITPVHRHVEVLANGRRTKWAYKTTTPVTFVNDMNTCACGSIMTIDPVSNMVVCISCRLSSNGKQAVFSGITGMGAQAAGVPNTYNREQYAVKRWLRSQGKIPHYIPVKLFKELSRVYYRDAVSLVNMMNWKITRMYLTELGYHQHGFYDNVPIINAGMTGVMQPQSSDVLDAERNLISHETERTFRQHFRGKDTKNNKTNCINVLGRDKHAIKLCGHPELCPFLPGAANAKNDALIKQVYDLKGWEFSASSPNTSILDFYSEEELSRFFKSDTDLYGEQRVRKRNETMRRVMRHEFERLDDGRGPLFTASFARMYKKYLAFMHSTDKGAVHDTLVVSKKASPTKGRVSRGRAKRSGSRAKRTRVE